MFLISDCEFVYSSVYLTKHKNYCSMRLMSRLNQLNKLLESLHLLITYVDFLPYFNPEQKKFGSFSFHLLLPTPPDSTPPFFPPPSNLPIEFQQYSSKNTKEWFVNIWPN